MEKQIEFRVPEPIETWKNDDTFIDDTKRNVGRVLDSAVEKVKTAKNKVVDEAKTIAPEAVETIKDSASRLNREKQVIPGIKNSYLVWGGAIVLGYWVLNKFV